MHWYCQLSELSREHCIAICAALVPANLLATLAVMIATLADFSPLTARLTAIPACVLALLLALHVISWLQVGVVMAPTFILLALSCVCLLIQRWCLQRSALGSPLGSLAPSRNLARAEAVISS
jgi:hypothetical protein